MKPCLVVIYRTKEQWDQWCLKHFKTLWITYDVRGAYRPEHLLGCKDAHYVLLDYPDAIPAYDVESFMSRHIKLRMPE